MTALRVASLMLGAALLLRPAIAAAQLPAHTSIERERREYAQWLAHDPASPFAAYANQPLSAPLTLGTDDSDVRLPGLALHTITSRNGQVTVAGPNTAQTLIRGRPVRIDRYLALLTGLTARPTVVVYGPMRPATAPAWFPVDPSARFEVTLTPPPRSSSLVITAADGLETTAAEAGTIAMPSGERLMVRRIETGQDEQELEVYVRDGSSGDGSYPAGRFVTLQPLGGTRYVLDFNRARNPFCAYNSVFPCPAPWPGNTVAHSIRAGERYGK